MSKVEEDRVRPRPEGDPANGPWHHYMEDQAEQDRKAKFLGDEELSCFAHERNWESVGLKQLLSSNEHLAELLVKAFYLGRASANRERPHARRMVSEALNACHIRYQKAAAEAFSVILQSRGAE
jgi:hypothetical protein